MEIVKGNKKISFEVSGEGPSFTLRTADGVKEMEAVPAGSNAFTVSAGGRQANVFVTDDEERYYAWIGGRVFEYDKVREEERDFSDNGAANCHTQVIYPPMPGSVIKIMADIGQEVCEGDPLIAIEAMKMEMTLYSAINGSVSGIYVKQGEQVTTDRPLIKIGKVFA